MGEQYVRKHIDAKHYDKLCESNMKKLLEKQMFDNYCKDESRFINQPSSIGTIMVPPQRGRRYDRERETRYEERRKAKQESYVDWDDPSQQQRPAKPVPKPEADRPMISYDDL